MVHFQAVMIACRSEGVGMLAPLVFVIRFCCPVLAFLCLLHCPSSSCLMHSGYGNYGSFSDQPSSSSGVQSRDCYGDGDDPPPHSPAKTAAPYKCRFCESTFEKSQALGGHMNRHRLERDREALDQAHKLVKSHNVGQQWSEFDTKYVAPTLPNLTFPYNFQPPTQAKVESIPQNSRMDFGSNNQVSTYNIMNNYNNGPRMPLQQGYPSTNSAMPFVQGNSKGNALALAQLAQLAQLPQREAPSQAPNAHTTMQAPVSRPHARIPVLIHALNQAPLEMQPPNPMQALNTMQVPVQAPMQAPKQYGRSFVPPRGRSALVYTGQRNIPSNFCQKHGNQIQERRIKHDRSSMNPQMSTMSVEHSGSNEESPVDHNSPDSEQVYQSKPSSPDDPQ